MPVLRAEAALTLLLLVNVKIWTGNPRQPEAKAAAIQGNRILAVGSMAEILEFKLADAPTIDLHGKRVVAGFNDAHVHFHDGGANLAGPQLRYSKSQEEFRNTLEAYAKGQPAGRWILGGDWDHENWTPADLPTRQLIDAATPSWPVFINRLDGHMVLANSLARPKTCRAASLCATRAAIPPAF